MTLLEIVQALHREAQLPGSVPSTVTGQTGRAADLVRWAIEAWKDIQREKGGRWKWLRGSFTLDTTASDPTYAYGDATDVELTGAITRFRAWDLDPRDPPHIYLVSDGAATEREIFQVSWREFRYRYQRATHTASYPQDLGVDPQGNLHFGPTPDGIYRLSGNFWRSVQALANDADEPEMPDDFHMLIVWRAMTKYGYNAVARHLLARAQKEGGDLYEALVNDQAYSLFSLTVGEPLA